jgi:flagellar M-ring protein FliF
MPIRQLIARLSPRGWTALGGSVAAVLLFTIVAMNFASQPTYSTLLTGLDPAQTGKITSTLDTKGIGYQIQNNGTALAVDSGKTAQARIALATAGLLGTTSQQGFSLFDKQQLGSSNFQQQITYQRALEGQLAQTIESIQGVSGAQVQLVLPTAQDQLFSDQSTPATAAVLLSGASTLDPSSVRGIAQLVSSSVPGLALGKVTITDGTGQLLWPASGYGSADGTGLSKQDAEARYDATMAAQVNAMLAQTLGPGKAQVEVHSDLNVDQATSDTLTYSHKGVPLQTHSEVETLKGAGGTGGVTGTAGNITTVAQTAAGSGTSNYSHKITDTTLGVNKTVTHAVIAPGKVNQQTVSVLIDKSVPATSVPAIKAAIANAVGLVPARGDQLSIGQLKFAGAAVKAPAAGPAKMMGYAKYALVGLGALIFLFFVGRMLRRREREALAGQPTWLRELETRRPLASLDGGGGGALDGAATEVRTLRPAVNVAKRQVEDLIERDPDRVAQQVRAWMSED